MASQHFVTSGEGSFELARVISCIFNSEVNNIQQNSSRVSASNQNVACIPSVSPVGANPTSARSDHNVKSIEEEIEEEIEEDLSVAEDLLQSDNSGVCY